ncbi:MAG TPA: type III-B CRISPR module-associated protein Cmr5 [Ignavibacteria bacterium]|nr:type III-B CRISPR module-associated protein Cmr5 [Ignavibacteria bacterium]
MCGETIMSNNTMIRGLQQGRASFAYEYANQIDDKLKNKFKSLAKSFPMLVKTNGLGAAVAFLFSKKDKEMGMYKLVGDSIVEWLKKDDRYKNYGLERLTDLKSLAEGAIKLNSPEYRALTIEILAFFNWLRRFAEGLAEDKK